MPDNPTRDTEPVPGAQPPRETKPPLVRDAPEVAAGLASIYQTGRFVWKDAGVIRGTHALLKINQIDGFDCQSCAWPSPDQDRHLAEFCENGAKALAHEATRKQVDPAFFERHPLSWLREQSDHWLGRQGRLTHPMILKEGADHYVPISWDEAFQVVGKRLKAPADPSAAAFYTSGRTSNEAAFLYQLFVRLHGSNNLPDCSNMCHESSGAGLGRAIGIGKGTVTLEDFEKADAIFIAGQNPGTNHPRMMASLEAAKRKGARIVSINPLSEAGLNRFRNPQHFKNPLRALPTAFGPGQTLTDLHLPVRINGDTAVFKGMMKAMLEEEDREPGSVFDHDFILNHTHGYPELIQDLRLTEWAEVEEQSGLPASELRKAAAIAMESSATICCWAMGLTQHQAAVGSIQTIVNFLLLRGDIGRPGAGACPVRGHSNVQGDRTMGIWERMPDAFLDRLGAEFGFEPPRRHGTDTVETIEAMLEGRIRTFVAMGGNFLSAAPDTELTARALQGCDLTVQISTTLNRSHLITGKTALILPCLGRSEIDRQADGTQFVTTEDSMGVINSSRGLLEPASDHLLSEPAIVAGLAAAVLPANSKCDWTDLIADYDRIRERIERVIPGFDAFNERVRQGPFHLPNGPRDSREFRTASGRAEFHVHPIPKTDPGPGHFVLMTIRSHDQFNTTIYGLDDRYRGVYNGRRLVFMHPEDMGELGLKQGDPVDLASHFNGEMRRVEGFFVAPYAIPRRCAAAYFPEANPLVPIDSVAAISNTPASKSILISIVPAADPQAAIERARAAVV